MNISGIRPSATFYSYNSIKINELRNQQIAAAEQARMAQETTVDTEEIEERPVVQNYSSFDYAQNYQPNETYDLKGTDSELGKLDVEKAVSDLDKDKVLQQYQYFVGSEKNAVTKTAATAEPAFRTGENFSL